MALVKGIYHSVGAPLFAFRVSLFRRFLSIMPKIFTYRTFVLVPLSSMSNLLWKRKYLIHLVIFKQKSC